MVEIFQAKTWSSHVTKAGNESAVTVLYNHWKWKKPISFGFMGTGLVPMDKNNSCEVITRGITVYEKNRIVAFHDPV